MSWTERFAARESALCIGLDPMPERMPAGLDARDFCLEVMEITAEYAACFKPNIGFFEQYGIPGLQGLVAVLADAREREIPVILDAKRGDIASTAEAYARAYFDGPFDADAITVNPSVGLDGIAPFTDRAREHDRGVILLLRTSNEGAGLFQDAAEPELVRVIRDEPVFGAVVASTAPETGARLRRALPDTLFLVPGFGAQGGDSGLAAFFTSAGRGAVVNSSRGILYPETGAAGWKDAVRAAARDAHARIERARKG